MYSEPVIYSHVDSVPILVKDYKFLPQNSLGQELYLIVFGPSDDLGNPKVEPIIYYNHAGNHQFMWRDKYWGQYDLDVVMLRNRTRDMLMDLEGSEWLEARGLTDPTNMLYSDVLERLRKIMHFSLFMLSLNDEIPRAEVNRGYLRRRDFSRTVVYNDKTDGPTVNRPRIVYEIPKSRFNAARESAKRGQEDT